jgi:hypothetical protein
VRLDDKLARNYWMRLAGTTPICCWSADGGRSVADLLAKLQRSNILASGSFR